MFRRCPDSKKLSHELTQIKKNIVLTVITEELLIEVNFTQTFRRTENRLQNRSVGTLQEPCHTQTTCR